MTKMLPERISIDAIREARERIKDVAVRTPLIRLYTGGPREVWLKLETLQPVGSFKLRGARNALGEIDAREWPHGVYTASAGNMALGLAWCAQRWKLGFTAIVPEHAPAAKVSKLEQLGARIVRVPFERWWSVIAEHHFDGEAGRFVHPVADAAVMAGNGTIGLEVLEELPDVETFLIPFGGGGLACGIASAVRGMGSSAKIIACEIETATPLSAALEAGGPRSSPRTPSFVDGIGGAGVLPEMWPLIKRLIDGVAVATLTQTAGAIRTMLERAHVVAEGAGAVPVAAALAGKAGNGPVCCIVSGGNIDASVLTEILSERM